MRCLSEDAVMQFVQGELATAAAAEVERHLDECAECRDLMAAVGRMLPPADAPASLVSGGPVGAPAAPIQRGTTVGRYVILDLIGTGGMSVVYSAYDAELDRKVALKLLRPDTARGAHAAEVRARLLREAQALARLAHPNVVAVFDAGTFRDEIFLAMELVEGPTLAAWLREPRPWRQVVTMFQQAGAGLGAAHAAGLVHRDFKPDNVLVGPDRRARVVDFGLARPVADLDGVAADGATERGESALTRPGARPGTPAYMAPEQHRGQAADARSDQFSFCVALYEALYGQRPPAPEEAIGPAAETRVHAPAPDRRPPAWLRRVVLRGLSAAREDRYPSMGALLAALTRSPRRRWYRAAGIAAAVVLLGAAGLGVRAHGVRQRAQCRADARLVGVWDAPRRAATRAAFLATGAPRAATAWRELEARLDAYATAWVAARTAACEATPRGGQSTEVRELRLQCLDWRLEELRALTTLLEQADAMLVAQAGFIVEKLTPLDGCAATTALMRRPRPPRDPRARAQVDELRTRLVKARVLHHAGRAREALVTIREIAAGARAAGHQPVEAEALWALGIALRVAGDIEEAEGVLWQAAAVAGACGHDEAGAGVWIDLIWVSAGRGGNPAKLTMAARYAQQAAAALERLGGLAHLEARLSHSLAMLATERGRFKEAQAHCERNLALVGKASPALSSWQATALQGLGEVVVAQGRLTEGVALEERALAIRERELGPDHPRLADYLSPLAAARVAQGRPEEGLALARRALALARQGYRAGHPLVGEALAVAGRSYAALGRYDEALAHHREAVALYRARGPDDPRAAAAMDDVGTVLRLKGRLPEAALEHQRALAILARAVEPDHPELARGLHELGETLRLQGEVAGALDALERALAIREKAAIPPADLAATRFALAQTLAAAGRDRPRARELAVLARAGYAGAEGRHEAQVTAIRRWLERVR
ncbi:MAG TPA: tetratricopeptide repeat protein [Polyangia bacterium]|jgi:tetratricopeptide (TPR) repeat protein/predicted Ser/Thr protein kinase